MKTVQSAHGTTIAFDQLGKGAALILVDGALGHRAMDSGTAQLASLLAQHFTVFHYDRRGGGQSTDTLPYAVSCWLLSLLTSPMNSPTPLSWPK